ncbi:uncharacterized protein N7484_000918 [Penicillium longicatenatum]|uniref:uncharacterized protein n=1 Tax=Penicillium longicatenatum TaxID=1561947 RepID=UPI0025477FAD|nr:uncharacterized protein N7484_000918 [Penicillium longicatenatum]KAJ5657269.1 hypothetical protein N7484_000918 [Penicillium longicatenatum]
MPQSFAATAQQLLDPRSDLSQKYPHLHHGLKWRLEKALSDRNHEPISRCGHVVFNGYEIGRNDESIFQNEENSAFVDFLDPITKDHTGTRLIRICNKLTDRMEIYGTIGHGTFAAVYLARERCGPGQDPRNVRHFAVKVERHHTVLGDRDFMSAPVVPIHDNADQARYIPTEALYLLFLSSSDRFPKLDSVYIHDRYQAIVMSACVDPALDRWSPTVGSCASFFPSFTGKYLMTKDNRAILDELSACKVAAQLLEAVADMAQINLFHYDLSLLNFVVDQNLNVQLIDLGNVWFGLDDGDFISYTYAYLPFQEYQMLPELAEVLFRPENRERDLRTNIWVEFENDVRQITLWKYGVIVYGFLHGYWPWDNPPAGGHEMNILEYQGEENQRVCDRRVRMMWDGLPIREDLSQDCKDVLRHLFQRDPAKRPSLEALVTYPWFSQWTYQNRIYVRPFSQEFQDVYCRSI